MTTEFQRRKYRQILLKKVNEKKEIKEAFVDTGEADKLLEILKEKRKPSITPDQLPF